MNYSDEELSRWIAVFLEPDLPSAQEYVNRCERRGGRELEDRPKAWKILRRFVGTFEYQWQPLDFVNDPAMTVMLLEKLVAAKVVTILGPVDSGDDYSISFGEFMQEKPNLCAKSLGRAVAEAFALANNLCEVVHEKDAGR